jgi:4-amino-4-deoxy-L-arabinose transferase-like glycosyltransferase
VWLLLLWGAAGVATLVFLPVAGLGAAAAAVMSGGAFLAMGTWGVRLLARGDRVFSTRLFTGAFLARYVVALLVSAAVLLSGLPGLKGGKDYISWEAGGWAVAEAWRSGTLSVYLVDSDPGYYYLIGAVYTITGRVPIAPTLLNGLFGAGAAVVAFFLAMRLYDRRTGVVAGMLAAFLPNLLVWSSLLYKDVVLSFFVAATVYCAIEVYHAPTRRWVVLLGLSLVPLFMIRPESAMTLVSVTALLITLAGRRRGSKLAALVAAGGMVLLLLVVLQAAGLAGKLDLIAKFRNPLAAATNAREVWADEVGARATGLSRYLYGKNLLLSPHLLLVALVMPFLLPLPGSAGLEMSITAFLMPGQVVWLLLLPAILFGAVSALGRGTTPPHLYVVGVIGALVLGVAVAGYFSNPRYLVQGVPVMMVLAAHGVGAVRRRLLVYLSMLMGVMVVFCLYGLVQGL